MVSLTHPLRQEVVRHLANAAQGFQLVEKAEVAYPDRIYQLMFESE
jgi:hypothetical protein